MKKERLLVVTEVFHPEDFLINDLVAEWCKRGFAVEVLTRNPSYPFGRVYQGYKNRLYQKDRVGQALVHRIHFIPGYRESTAVKILNYLWNALLASVVAVFIGRRFDKVFIYQTGPLTFALPGVLAGKLYGKAVTIWTQDIWPDSVFAYGIRESKFKRFLLDAFVGFVYRNCTNVLVTARGFIPKIKKYVPEKEVHLLPQWSLVDYSNFKTGDGVFKEHFNFTFAGNIGKLQNLENVIRGFGAVAANNNEIRLNIVGDGSNLEQLKAIVKKHDYPGIVFWGRQPLERMPEFLLSSTVLIISLQNKEICALTVPAKFQAYLAAGKPILSIMPGEVSDIVEENKLGLSCHPDDIEDIARKFQRFAEMTEAELRSISENVGGFARENYHRQTLIEKITDCIRAC